MCRYRSSGCCYYKQLSGGRWEPSTLSVHRGKREDKKKYQSWGWQYCNPFSKYINVENTTLQELLIFTEIIFPIIFMITVTVFIKRKTLSLACHVAQEIIDSALKHAQLKMNNKFWRELCIIHDDKKVTEWKAGRLKVTNVHSSSLKISHGIRM